MNIKLTDHIVPAQAEVHAQHNHNTTSKTNACLRGDDSFDAFLHFDNYYWHHQNQLQPSALTFKSHPSEDNASAPTIHAEATAESSMQSIDTPAMNQVNTTSIMVTIEAPKQADTTKARFSLESFIEGIETHVNPPFHVLERIQIQSAIRDEKAAAIQTTAVASPASFKNYHVFTDEACIELTLNTRALSSQESSQLQRTIKQWLVQQGYTLKTLIINGVKQ